MKPTDVYLLTGCLGAGKTSALNHLLREPALAGRRVALLVNEFGELGIDGKLVEAEGVPLYELNRGSLFCACIRHDAVAALKAIALKVDPELLLVEATGLADPADLEQWLLAPGGGLPVVDGGSVAAIDLSHR
ncbi:MAG: GTP-binding protein, partial [Planctomycetota bacterium]